MIDDISCRSGLNILRDSEAACGSVPHLQRFLSPVSLCEPFVSFTLLC